MDPELLLRPQLEAGLRKAIRSGRLHGACEHGLPNGPDAALLDPAVLGGVLTPLGELRAKFAAAQAGFLRRFDAADAHHADPWGRHPHLAYAMAAGQISPSRVAEIDRLTR